MKTRRSYTAADDQTVMVDYAAGVLLSAIADRLGRSYASVQNRVHRLVKSGCIPELREYTKYSAQQDEQLIALYQAGATYPAIARALGKQGSMNAKIRRLMKKGTLERRKKPAPVKPAPVKPAPVKPAPVKPAPVKPAPVKPAPVKPAPVKLAPVKPAAPDRGVDASDLAWQAFWSQPRSIRRQQEGRPCPRTQPLSTH